ncbi:MAG TPA: hypothetical protein VFC12_01805 [Terriglobales bacterium]|nr:hypothetical protein [Terriglobales bacterium]
MKQSIAAKHVAWSSARLIRPATREWERRLGLHSSLTFQRASTRQTILRPSHGGLQVDGWRPATPHRSAPLCGLVRAPVKIHWTGVGRPQAARRSSLAPASWRG